MAKRIPASESLLGKKIKCTDGYSYKVVGLNTYGYKLECGGPQIPANRVIKKGRSFVELEKADPENAYSDTEAAAPAKTTRKKAASKAKAKTTRKPRAGSRRKAAETPKEKPARKTRKTSTRKAKAEKKSPIRKRGVAKDTTLELDVVEIETKNKPVVDKKPVNKFTKALTSELRASVKAALLQFIEDSQYDIELRAGTVEAVYNNATDPNDKSLDGPICRMAFDIVPVEASMEADVADDDMVDDDASGLKFDSNGRVDIAAMGVLDANEMRSLKRNFDKLARTDVNVGSFEVGQGVLHSKTDSLFVLAGFNPTKNICILIEPETGEIKRIKPSKMVDQCEYIDLTEYFSGNASDEESNIEDDLGSVDPDELDFDDDDLLDEDADEEEFDEDEDENEEEFDEDEDENEEEFDEDEDADEAEDDEDLDFDEDFGDFE